MTKNLSKNLSNIHHYTLNMTNLEQDTGFFFFKLGTYYILGASAFFFGRGNSRVVISLSHTVVKDLDRSLTYC